jgi:CIC family chloride channel protein
VTEVGEGPHEDGDDGAVPLRSRRLDGALDRSSGWLRASRLGLVVMALIVGVGGGFGAVGFRWLIYGFTWLVTGHEQFGVQGRR